jgi:HK97 gp10 family phage protein
MAGALSDRRFAQLVGLDQAKRQMRTLPDVARKLHYVATRDSAEAILAAAKAAAPVRREGRPPGYAGGALRDHLAMKGTPAAGMAIIGIEKVALVVRTRGGRGAGVATFHDHKFKRARDGKWTRRTLSRPTLDRLRAGGARVIRPTKYGHLQEFGAPQHAAKPFLRPAVRAEQAAFEGRHRAAVAEVQRLLGAAGYHG